MLPYEQAEEQQDEHFLYNHPLGRRAETMNKLVPMVSVEDTDPQIEGEITPLFNVSGLLERQPDHSSADLQSNKTARRKKTTWKKIAQKYKNEKKIRHDTSRYEIIETSPCLGCGSKTVCFCDGDEKICANFHSQRWE